MMRHLVPLLERSLAITLACSVLPAHAINEIRMIAPIRHGASSSTGWIEATALLSEWSNTQDAPSCSTWLPDQNTVGSGQAFEQTSTDCAQKQERTSQARQQNSSTLEFRNVGIPVVEQQFITTTMTRTAQGTKALTQIAEGSSFVLTETTVVSYGVIGQTISKSFAAGTWSCTSSWMGGDPAPGKVKYCFLP